MLRVLIWSAQKIFPFPDLVLLIQSTEVPLKFLSKSRNKTSLAHITRTWKTQNQIARTICHSPTVVSNILLSQYQFIRIMDVLNTLYYLSILDVFELSMPVCISPSSESP